MCFLATFFPRASAATNERVWMQRRSTQKSPSFFADRSYGRRDSTNLDGGTCFVCTPLFPVYVRYQNQGYVLLEFPRGSFITFWLNNAEVCMTAWETKAEEGIFFSLPLVDPAAAARAKWKEARRNLIKSWRGGLLRVHSASAGRSGEDFF